MVKRLPGDSEDEDGNLTDMFSHRRKSYNLPDSPLSTPPKKATANNNNENNFSKSANLNIIQDSLTNSGSIPSNSNSVNNTNSNDTPNTTTNNNNNTMNISS